MMFTKHDIIIAYLVIAFVVCLGYNVALLLKRHLDLERNSKTREACEEEFPEWDDFMARGTVVGVGWPLFVSGYLMYAVLYVLIRILHYVCYHGYRIILRGFAHRAELPPHE
jgi:hypothetical protein